MAFHIKLNRFYVICIISLIGITFISCLPEYHLLNYSARTLYPDCGIFPADSGSKNILTMGLSISKALDSSKLICSDGSYLASGRDSIDGNRLNTFLYFDPIYVNTFIGYDFFDCLSSISELKMGFINGRPYYDWTIGFGLRLAGDFYGSHILGQVGMSNISNDLYMFVRDTTDYYIKTNNTGSYPSVGISITANTVDETTLRPFLNLSSKFYFPRPHPNGDFDSDFWSNSVAIGLLKNIKQTSFLFGFKFSQMSYSSITTNTKYFRPSLVFQVTRRFR